MTSITPFLPHFLTTLQNRPYVFLFLVFFLFFGFLQFGKIRTFLFLFLGWAIAFLSEYSSIRNGFPYGWYRYLYENLQGELIVGGVPLWDSLSYTFIAYASYATSLFLFLPSHSSSGEYLKLRTSKKVWFVSIVLMTGIDVVIDPLAHQGEKWFLGKIYEYFHPGIYFDVPFSNFLGWALVAAVIVGLFQWFDRKLEDKGFVCPQKGSSGIYKWLGFFLYGGVFLFNWGITLWLGEWKLVLFDLGLFLPLLWFALRSRS